MQVDRAGPVGEGGSVGFVLVAVDDLDAVDQDLEAVEDGRRAGRQAGARLVTAVQTSA
ncbi:hypothetical protein [Streptomyces sp. NPDC059168]|uniref:hypothetical protein n=1 Tax=Streptomyces sp. NPDC059168 TaxID=3346753 RepID=UPI0036C98D87